MPYQEDFDVEQFMDAYETGIKYNLGETCCSSLSLDEIHKLSGNEYQLDTSKPLSYGAIKGTDALRNEIAKLYDSNFSKDNVLITNGAIGANFLLYYTLAGDAGHAICVNPTYAQLYSVPKMFGSKVDLLNLEEKDGFLPNIATFKSLIRDTTCLVIINNPNNPLGSVIDNELLKEICQICEANNIYLHCDEVYRPIFHSLLPNKQLPLSACQLYDKAIATGSMSKAFSVAGIRIGWIVTQDKKLLRDAASRRDYNTISVSMVDDSIAQYVLKNKEFVIKRNYDLVLKNLEVLKNFVKTSDGRFEFLCTPEAGTVCMLKCSGISNTKSFAEFMATKHKILAVPGEAFGIPGSIRVGYGNSKTDIECGLPVLLKAYDEFIKK